MFIGKSVGRLLGDHGAIHTNFKNSTAARDEFDVDVQLSFDFVRHTGGSRKVVSNLAIFDSNHLISAKLRPSDP